METQNKPRFKRYRSISGQLEQAKHPIILLFFLLLTAIKLFAQPQLSPDTVLTRVWQQTNLYPQEKLHVHTDKSTYISGEKIWLRSYVVNALNHQQETTSRYVYAELLSPFNKIIYRIRLRQDSLNCIHGHIALEDTLSSGEYTLRAYTRYMENTGEDYLFRKPIHIVHPLAKSLRLETEWNKNNELTVKFINQITNEPMPVRTMAVWNEKEQLWHRGEETQLHVKVNTKSLKHKTLLVQGGNYRQYISVEGTTANYDVSFLPEGGNLLEGVLCKVAFKAMNSLGLGENIEGEVVDEKDSLITAFQSLHRGMGSFSFIPANGKSYKARCRNASGMEKQFFLPQAHKDSYALKITEQKDKIYVSVLHSATTHKQDSLILLVHQRGLPKYAQPWDYSRPFILFTSDCFISGPVHVLLLNTKGKIISERLLFINNNDKAVGKVFPDKEKYAARDKITLNLTVTDIHGNLLEGDCSIAVTNNADVRPDSCVTILSNLLLTSELKGFIEDPNWYFRGDQTKEKRGALDVLMLTQGWRRYDIQSVVEGNFHLPQILPEENMSIQGKVITRVLRKPVSESFVRIASPDAGMVEEVMTNEEGRFILRGFEFPDTTKYLVTAYNQKGKDRVVLSIDPERFPDITLSYPGSVADRKILPVGMGYLTRADTRTIYETGIRNIFMDEVVITASMKKANNTIYQTGADRTVSEEEILKSSAQDIRTLLSQTSGLLCTTQGVFYTGKPATIVVDEVVINDEVYINQILNLFNKDDIEQIDIIKGFKTLGYPGGNGYALIAITTKRGGSGFQADQTATNMGQERLLGYQRPLEFYSPRYETIQEKENTNPDLRTTIYWKPDIKVKKGNAEVTFYAADGLIDYSIVCEGIGEKGEIIRICKEDIF